MELHPPLHLSLVAIEKGPFGSPSTKIANFTFFFLVSWVINDFRFSKIELIN